MADPKVTVLMSVYNGENHLREAVDSILGQTFEDFEFLIVDDGSTDRTAEILQSYHNVRMRIVGNEKNIGLTKSLNIGLGMARGEYIARMDADDVSLPERLQKQVDYINMHQDIGIVGTWIEYVDENGVPQGEWRMPTTPGLIGWHLCFGTCLAHPSVMMRRNVIEQLGFYHADTLRAQDYELWTRATFVTRLANMPEFLLQRRVCEEGITRRHSHLQEQTVVRAMRSMIPRLLGSEVTAEQVAGLRRVAAGQLLDNLQEIETVANLIYQLYRTYSNSGSLSRTEAEEIAHHAGGKLHTLAIEAGQLSIWRGFLIYRHALTVDRQLFSVWPIAKATKTLIGKALRR